MKCILPFFSGLIPKLFHHKFLQHLLRQFKKVNLCNTCYIMGQVAGGRLFAVVGDSSIPCGLSLPQGVCLTSTQLPAVKRAGEVRGWDRSTKNRVAYRM